MTDKVHFAHVLNTEIEANTLKPDWTMAKLPHRNICPLKTLQP
jgi:hypothetical protein